MSPEAMKAVEDIDNPFEAFFALLIYYMVEIIFKMVEVVVDFAES